MEIVSLSARSITYSIDVWARGYEVGQEKLQKPCDMIAASKSSRFEILQDACGADDPIVLYDEHLFINMNRRGYSANLSHGRRINNSIYLILRLRSFDLLLMNCKYSHSANNLRQSFELLRLQFLCKFQLLLYGHACKFAAVYSPSIYISSDVDPVFFRADSVLKSSLIMVRSDWSLMRGATRKANLYHFQGMPIDNKSCQYQAFSSCHLLRSLSFCISFIRSTMAIRVIADWIACISSANIPRPIR